MDIKEKKQQLRKKVKEIKNTISLADKKIRSAIIWKQLEETLVFKEAKTVMLYWSMDDEVYTHEFVEKWSAKKRIILPCVNGDNLELRIFSGIEEMKPGEHFNILEPIGQIFTEASDIDLIIIPGVAFDKQNNRMGRGKGYYDKLLETTSAYKIGVCFNFQLFEEVPVDVFDIKMDAVISEL